ncbi:hypothetical protein [Myxococcus sp. AB036A]|uniref:hypothetical protein n=1 Tax=Myxococcus sp. AB036A TaxID=2562793 RepID=UPI001146CDBF|nr:hypothetical protein [Myxococcus sp. AB036A]
MSPSEPFLKSTALEAAERVYALAANRLTRLSLGTDPDAAGREVMRRLVSRSTVLRPSEVMLLKMLVSATQVRPCHHGGQPPEREPGADPAEARRPAVAAWAVEEGALAHHVRGFYLRDIAPGALSQEGRKVR